MAETATALRSQLKDQLRTRIGQTQDLLNAYYEAYPHLGQGEPTLQQPVPLQGTWSEVGQTLAQQPVLGVNVHARPEGLRPSWIAEQTIEPVEFGSLADPISQLAFLAAPGMLRAGKSALETVAAPGPSRVRALGYERGNLGPVPRSQAGEPLPGSAVRDEAGKLKRLYHGTRREFGDFAMTHSGTGAGGDLYGPGIYMTEDPAIATGYSTQGGSRPVQLTRLDDLEAYYQPGRIVPSYSGQDRVIAFEPRDGDWRVAVQAVDRQGEPLPGYRPRWHQTPPEVPAAPNIRPVYADLKRPFDMTAPMPVARVQEMLTGTPGAAYESAANMLGGYAGRESLSGEEVYGLLTQRAFNGDKGAVNDYLQLYGYDGITHMGGAVTGGQPHRVYIAFSPDNVYPSVNVEGTP